MATKAELEVELARLRKELSESKRGAPQEDLKIDDVADQENAPKLASLFEDGDIEGTLKQLFEDLETLPIRKPVLTALGIFFVGYVFGRSGHRG